MNWAQMTDEGSERAVFSTEGSSFVFEDSLKDLLLAGVAQGIVDAATACAAGGQQRKPLESSELTLPVRPGKTLCIGLNFSDHAQEVGQELPTHPTIFTKFDNALIGVNDDIELPAADLSTRSDWEVELAVVVGRRVRRVNEAQAREAIFGYTVANDISVRDWQGRTSEWFQGKNWDRSTPLGPVIVPAQQLDVEGGLAMRCTVDGVARQDGSTRSMVFSPAQVLAYISQFMTLEPGDIILTGTPAGVGVSLRPRAWLAPGQVVETEIEGIGKLVNRCIAGQ
ncbi:fumarylacetoacetate hydrolase family protein [Rothia sp. ZJ932]|uniref:fumarylacetoacetate hydrolase family protein n=1 Tax=Rothia sp. ZJ932 TaxID=2810516 RepID=UPI001967E0D6|nr:fumarylacetoacetate hydrolase family protein [Rothia sp. ZJ932]QRZ62438.1 fumarylacetoacetate hydrolase family protein [Rothia sp. ZJ932]